MTKGGEGGVDGYGDVPLGRARLKARGKARTAEGWRESPHPPDERRRRAEHGGRAWAPRSPVWACAGPGRQAAGPHSPHDSLVVVPPLPRGPAVHAPAAIGTAGPRGAPSAGLQQAVVESVGAGLVVALPLVAAA